MRAVILGFVAAIAWMAATSAPAAAQERDWWGWAFERPQDGREYHRSREARDRRYRPHRDEGRGAGPPFCRDGRGHPVHGWAWCRSKGFGRTAVAPVIWRRHHWDVPRFRSVRRDPHHALLGAMELRIALGDAAYRSLARHGHRMGIRDPLVGRWYRPAPRTLVLQVRSGPFPVAELSDLDGDGRVDVVLLAAR